MTRLLLDVDGVLGNMVGRVLPIINKLNTFVISESDITDWKFTKYLQDEELYSVFLAAMSEPGFCRTIAPYSEAQTAITKLQRQTNKHTITVVTSYMHSSTTWVYDRNLWLEEHFNIRRSNIIHTAKKHLIAGDVFVDDKIGNVVDWAKHNPRGIAVLWDKLYNCTQDLPAGSKILRMNNWDDLIKLVEEIYQFDAH